MMLGGWICMVFGALALVVLLGLPFLLLVLLVMLVLRGSSGHNRPA